MKISSWTTSASLQINRSRLLHRKVLHWPRAEPTTADLKTDEMFSDRFGENLILLFSWNVSRFKVLVSLMRGKSSSGAVQNPVVPGTVHTLRQEGTISSKLEQSSNKSACFKCETDFQNPDLTYKRLKKKPKSCNRPTRSISDLWPGSWRWSKPPPRLWTPSVRSHMVDETGTNKGGDVIFVWLWCAKV